MGLFRLLTFEFMGVFARANAERMDREEAERVPPEPCPECGRYNSASCRVCPRCMCKLYKLWETETSNAESDRIGRPENR